MTRGGEGAARGLLRPRSHGWLLSVGPGAHIPCSANFLERPQREVSFQVSFLLGF